MFEKIHRIFGKDSQSEGNKNRIPDMNDEIYVKNLKDPLKSHIRSVNDKLLPLYNEANEKANQAQKKHKQLAWLSLLAICFAAVLAVIQVTNLFHWTHILLIEMITVLGAFFVFAFDKVSLKNHANYHTKWLLERHRAERCRFLKFRQIIDPLEKKEFDERVQMIREIKEKKDVEDWISQTGLPIDDYSFRPPESELGFWELMQYYLDVRLTYQIHYYSGKNKKNPESKSILKNVEVYLFFIIGIITLLHIILEIWFKQFNFSAMEMHNNDINLAYIAIVIVAILFVIHTGFKIYAGYSAYPHIYTSYRTTVNSLEYTKEQINKIKNAEKTKNSNYFNNPSEDEIRELIKTIVNLYSCEEIMQSEHSHWFGIISNTNVI